MGVENKPTTGGGALITTKNPGEHATYEKVGPHAFVRPYTIVTSDSGITTVTNRLTMERMRLRNGQSSPISENREVSNCPPEPK